jgi:glycosyltransferase involved in cell wall biosynthesis
MTRDGRFHILYLARAYPPTTGGMEQLALRVSTHMQAFARVTMIVNRWGKKGLPAFLPYALAAALARVRRGEIDAVCLSDAALAPLGAALKASTGVTVAATVHGLDVTWSNAAYQAIVPRSLTHLDLVMPNSAATDRAMRERTGPRPPSQVIPLGVNPLPQPTSRDIEDFRRLSGVRRCDRALLTVGRLIERKGVAWFASHVLPALPDDAVYVVVGDGPERDAIAAAATRSGVSARVRMLGRVSDTLLAAAYATADVFVMPNVPVSGDMEGFGLVALEASAAGLPVVGAGIEGITEALENDRNGLLLPTRDAAAWSAQLHELLSLPPDSLRSLGERFASHTLATFGWDRTAHRYVDVMRAAVERTRRRTAAHAA